MSRSEHLAWEQIVDAAEGRRSASLNDHVSECESCARELRDAGVLVGSLYLAGAPEPSSQLMARTWSRLVTDDVKRQIGAVADRVRTFTREVWATLTADSMRPALAVRGSTTAIPRLLVYETDDFSVSLSITPAPTGFDLIGNVVPKHNPDLPAGGRVTVVGQAEAFSSITEFGEFRFSSVTLQGGTSIAVEFPEQRIQIGPLPSLAE